MDDTAQSFGAAETDPIASAAEAFKAAVPERIGEPEDTRPRDEHGKFVSTREEIEAPEAADEVAEGAESPEEVESLDEAADEAQPDPIDLPPSWPSELAEEWQTLPAAVQDKIVAREAEREAAVNAKFQEAANVRKANEAYITEAQQSAQKFVQAADAILTMVQPQRPPMSMLTPGSHDYNPDHYHLLDRQAQEQESILSYVQQQRQHAVAQLTKEAEAKAFEEIAEIEAKARPALLKDIPELSDAQKQPAILNEIVRYAIESGIPQDVFTDPEQAKYVTSAQLHLTWKAQQYDKMVAAKAKVQPRAAKPAGPVVKPGVATSPTQAKAIQRKNVTERLRTEGSIEAGAAFFKTIL
jgi:hypothetical protein